MQRLSKLLILHTNDLHSHFEQMPKIATSMRKHRADYEGDHVLTFDIGDHMDRMSPETEGSEGAANIAVLQATGYDAVTLGNNEGLTYSGSVLAERYLDCGFDVICSNMQSRGSGTYPDWLSPYRIFERGGVRIGVLGITADFTEFYSLLGWQAANPYDTVASLVAEIRPQADLVILLSHVGLKLDEQLAERIDGLDIILGGHTHHVIEKPRLINGTYVGAAGKWGRYVGVIELEFDKLAGRIASLHGWLDNVDDAEPAVDISAIINRYKISSGIKLSRVVCHLEQPLNIDWHEESRLGNLLAAGLHKWLGTEIGLVNAGQILTSLQAGTVTESMLLGEHIMTALEESLLDEFCSKRLYGFGFRGVMLGTLCISGMHVEYDPAAPDYRKIKGVWIAGIPLDPKRSYTVGTIDMFTFGIGYMSLRQGTELNYYLPEFLRDVLEKELQDEEAVRACSDVHWHRMRQGTEHGLT
jgi:5'-nucleotidase